MKQLLGHAAALMTIAIWGITFISTKLLLADLTAQEILFIRFLLGWLALWLFSPSWLGWQGAKTEATFALAGLFGVTLYFLLENIALEYTYASNVGVIVSSAPFFTGIAGWLCFGAPRLRTQFYAGFALAMAGICLISFSDSDIHISPIGDLLALLAAIAWAFYSELTKKLSALDFGSLKTTRRIFFYGLLLMLPVLGYSGMPATSAILLKPINLGNLLFLGLCASALCFAIWTFCLIRLGTVRASAYIYLVPVVTVLASAFWLGEPLSPPIITGMGLVLCGLGISEARFGKLAPRRIKIHPRTS